MTRIIEHSETGPMPIKKTDIAGDTLWLCRCGLSQNQPYCDASHKITRDEPLNAVFRYRRAANSALSREAVMVELAAPRGVA